MCLGLCESLCKRPIHLVLCAKHSQKHAPIFDINDLRVTVPSTLLSDKILLALTKGRYEGAEGAELNLHQGELPVHLRLISMELRPRLYGLKGIK